MWWRMDNDVTFSEGNFSDPFMFITHLRLADSSNFFVSMLLTFIKKRTHWWLNWRFWRNVSCPVQIICLCDLRRMSKICLAAKCFPTGHYFSICYNRRNIHVADIIALKGLIVPAKSSQLQADCDGLAMHFTLIVCTQIFMGLVLCHPFGLGIDKTTGSLMEMFRSFRWWYKLGNRINSRMAAAGAGLCSECKQKHMG